MTRNQAVLFLTAVVLCLSGICLAVHRLDPPSDHHCQFVHAPTTGCPRGSERSRSFFTERDGSHKDACEFAPDETRDCTVDVLHPGETFSLVVVVPDLPSPKRPI